MSAEAYVAIDQGGHATRAAAYDAQGRRLGSAIVTVATRRNALGHVEHEAQELVASVTTALEELAQLVPPVRWKAAGLAVQRSTIACWDTRDGQPLAPVISWQDRRNARWLQGLARQEPRVQELTGLPLSPHYGASKLRWCLDFEPRVRAAASAGTLAAGPLASFLLHRLLYGRPMLADAANASRTLLWSMYERGWSEELLELFGIPRAVLPLATATETGFGSLATGGASVPLVVCTGDQSVVPFAAGPVDRDAAYLNLGTGAFVLRPLRSPRPAAPLLTSLVRDDGRRAEFALEGTVNGAGAALAWLGQELGADAVRLLDLLDTAPLADEDAPLFLNGVSGLGSPFWQPVFESRFCGEGDALQRSRAVLESIAFLLKLNLDEMGTQLPAPSRLVVSGGLSANGLLCRMIASLAGVPVELASDPEASSRGLAYLVAGRPPGFQCPELRRIEPEPSQALLGRYLGWLEAMRAAIGR